MAAPKSLAGIRTIGLNDLAVWAPKSQAAQQRRDRLRAGPRWRNVEDLVFTTATGEPLNHRVVHGAFANRVRVLGLWPIRFHDLRHACATLLLTAGEDLGVISRVLGFSDLGTTLRVYAHLDPRRARADASRIDSALHRHLADVDAGSG